MEVPKSNPPSWPELLSSDHWTNLLSPLDLSLRNLLLRCGDLCQVTYDSFNSDPHSKYCGSCRYSDQTLLSKTNFPFAADYSVAGFLYATSDLNLPFAFLHSLSREAWSKESNWIGYVAVSSDASALATGRREIFVAWRGTIRDLEWRDVLEPELVPIQSLLSTKEKNSMNPDPETPKVMKGWYSMYTSQDPKSPFNKLSAREQLLSKIKHLIETYKEENLSIICVGHSLGASLAILSAFDMVENGLSKIEGKDESFPVCAVVFGSPQIGNKVFDEMLVRQPNLRVLHVRNKIDLIPLYPTGVLGYVDTGVKLVVDLRKSPYLKDSKNPSDWHNLQAILHTVAGWNGEGGEFELRVKRSVALVNKSCEYLKDECLVPGSWWVEKNKGMVMKEDGEWELVAPDDDGVPLPPNGTWIVGTNSSLVVEGNGKPVSTTTTTKKKSNSGGFGSCFCGGG